MGHRSEPLQLLLERLADSRERNLPLAPSYAGKAYDAINGLLDELHRGSVAAHRVEGWRSSISRSVRLVFGTRMRSHRS